MPFTHQKPPQFRFTSPSIHLRQVGYYKTVAEQSKALGDGIYTLQINNHCKLGSHLLAKANYRSHLQRSQAFCHKQLLNKELSYKQIVTSIFQLQAICHMHFVNTSIWESSKQIASICPDKHLSFKLKSASKRSPANRRKRLPQCPPEFAISTTNT